MEREREKKEDTSETETGPEEKGLSCVGRRQSYNLKENVLNAWVVLAISTSLESPPPRVFPVALTRYHLAASQLQPQTDPLAASTAEDMEDFLSFV